MRRASPLPERQGAAPDATVTLDRSEHTAIITLRRPAVRNAVDAGMSELLASIDDEIESDPDIWVTVITGEGPSFCSGADLRAVTERGPASDIGRGFAGITRRERSTPMIAAVEGAAMAGGFEIVLACDLVVAARDAYFGLPEVRRSMVAAGGGLVRLVHRLPRNIATELIVTGEPIGAERALELGLVNRVTEPGRAVESALSLARTITENAPIAVRESLAAVAIAATHGENAGWAASDRALANVQSSADFREGPRAFVEKRPPVWQNR